ncbi:Zn-dependent peptidase ImmA (M78 family) [Lysinibacillus composti]|uniref:ImmA/IrrE family metallo-endopeptidase n=1 Tax=Lysinibacillus composti TaxID=720633 RepID=A0A3N9UE39_9BACI|nr:ImmA/IrrE family metallo-endopeptidase [Lysinibacillus composti]MBM7608623.1 Zn-dependent peptidase ImmA (M78 family) [Lysinibacillus composti]RQW74544.1 ImmA/IrrE family metallo-endopeptidase [Lysinibacillus composti]
MINKTNLREVILSNYELLPVIQNRVISVFDKGIQFKYKPLQSIQNYLMKYADVIMFPSNSKNYGGLVTYRNGAYYIHINTLQPKTYENFIWAHEFYHFEFEKERIKNVNEVTFIDKDTALDVHERLANLFAAELLINKEILELLFKDKCEQNPDDPLATNIIRLIPDFKLPYKSLVIKLAQEKLITLDEAEEIIDYPYSKNLPIDFDLSILKPSKAIKIDSLNKLIDVSVSKDTMLVSDFDSILKMKEKHLTRLEQIRQNDFKEE